jgi:hypothetical protein
MQLIVLALVLSTFGVVLATSAFDWARVNNGPRPSGEFQAEGKSNSPVVRIPIFAGTFP